MDVKKLLLMIVFVCMVCVHVPSLECIAVFFLFLFFNQSYEYVLQT